MGVSRGDHSCLRCFVVVFFSQKNNGTGIFYKKKSTSRDMGQQDHLKFFGTNSSVKKKKHKVWGLISYTNPPKAQGLGLRHMLCNIIIHILWFNDDKFTRHPDEFHITNDIVFYQALGISTNNTMVQSTVSAFLSQSLYGLSPNP